MTREDGDGLGVQSVLRKVRWSLAVRGPGGTVKAAVQALGRRGTEAERAHPFDETHGTDTAGLIGGGTLATGSPNDAHIVAYAGVPPSRLSASLHRWAHELGDGETVDQFTFVDLGCGKGRAMLLASEHPFREVLGVELNPALAAVAERNMLLWKAAGHGIAPLRVLRGDATELVYPEGPLLVFLYNPFGLPVLRAVLDAMERHVKTIGARVDLLYQNEGPETPLRHDARLRQLWRGPVALSAEDAAADPVASEADVTGCYRWVG